MLWDIHYFMKIIHLNNLSKTIQQDEDRILSPDYLAFNKSLESTLVLFSETTSKRPWQNIFSGRIP